MKGPGFGAIMDMVVGLVGALIGASLRVTWASAASATTVSL
jgi:uncharacterized membrane protein YeaQ/YmgE (transglycosylase-associated protein family)